MSVQWCDYNCCEIYEVNEKNRIYKCKLTDMDDLPCDQCDDFIERDEEEF